MRLTVSRYDNRQPIEIELADFNLNPADSDILIAPGLVDLQVNGVAGIDFSDPSFDVQQAESVAGLIAAQGVTRFLPTVTTHSQQALAATMQRLRDAFEQSSNFARLAGGIHLEGPYISAEPGPSGAHPKEHCREPDWDEFCQLQEASGGRICLLTLSPEYPNTCDFIEKAVAADIRIAIGHTNADTQQISDAVRAGATLSTHLGNGAHASIRRHPNYIWDQLVEDRLAASLIVDGHHLPQNVVKSFVRCKGIENTILVSDITAMSGQPPGLYRGTVLGDVEVLEGGKLVVGGQREYLAGATTPLIECVGVAAEFAQVELATAIKMASLHPSRLLGWETNMAGPNQDAILFRENHGSNPASRIELRATIRAGEMIFGG